MFRHSVFLLAWGLALLPSIASAGDDHEEPAIKGYCPVSYHTAGKAVPGDPAFRSRYQGYTYQLADADSKTKFDASPERYVPQFAGLCTTALGGPYGNRFAADPTVFMIVEGKLYLFSSERARRAFETKPSQYAAAAAQRFHKPALDGYCPVSFQLTGAAVKGNESFKQVYRDRVYCFADEAVMAAFLKTPEKYLPAYDGFCTEGVSRGKRFPADPKVFAIREGRTFLFFDENARKAFEADPAKVVQAADEKWPELRNASRRPSGG